MSAQKPDLMKWLPAVHRLRDAEGDGVLRELLDVIGTQVGVLEEDLEQFYDDLFIETCADWVVPYIGDLIGYRSLHAFAPDAGSPRAEVANTIAYRRRKGTAAMLEQLARDVTGRPARVVEFFQRLATTQHMNHVRPAVHLTPDLRRWETIESPDGPFDPMARSVDTRRIATGEGRHNIPNIGVFIWRLLALSRTATPAVEVDSRRFRFSALGMDQPLFTRPETEPTITHLAGPLNVPQPIGRRRMFERPENYYAEGKSVLIEGVALEDVMVCDLSDHAGGWAHTPPPAGRVAIDPVLGRLAFGDPQTEPPRVTWHRGFGMQLGGGEYERADTFVLPAQPFHAITATDSLQDAIDNRVPGEPLQFIDNARHEGALKVDLQPGERFELRAANGRRPVLVLNGDLEIEGGDEESEVTLSGLLIQGGRVRVTGSPRRVRLVHCTLVPGVSVDGNGAPQQPDEPALIVEEGGVAIELDHCVTGAIRWHDLSRLELSDCIVDATRIDGVALAGPGSVPAGSPAPPAGTLRMEETTVVGKVRVAIMELVSNSILLALTTAGDGWPAPVIAGRRQTGCVRFSFVPAESRTPRRYRCQPDLEIQRRVQAAEREALDKNQSLSAAQREALRNEVIAWMKPAFTSTRFGDPDYGRLRSRSPVEIREGADDESEMGAFHDLFEPQRFTNLRIRLEEYLRFGLEAGVILVT